jgi:hypothetical protein
VLPVRRRQEFARCLRPTSARFLVEPATVLIRQALRGHLDGYIAIEPRIASAIDLAYASGAQC